ncbi:MAG: nucleoside/nucleotide kinase family protein [Pseudomonadota bacterium]
MPRTLTTPEFIKALVALAAGLKAGERHIVAIAGPPASGKSTLAESAVEAVNQEEPGRAALLPMDGYHFDDEVLIPRGHRPRKGAPHTFDVGGYRSALTRLIAGEADVAVPRFDREIEIARAGAIIIGADVRLVVTEGNWLLLNEPPWQDLKPLFGTTVLVKVDEDELARRLRHRWEMLGLTPAQVDTKLNDNDLPNGRRVMSNAQTPDIIVVP